MGNEPNRVAHGVRRSWKVRIASGFVVALNTAWFLISSTITAANLPSDASQAWATIVGAPEYIPGAMVAASLGILIWSLWPPKIDAVEPIAAPDDPGRLYQEELARRRAVLRAQEVAEHESAKRKLIRTLGFGSIGELWEEAEKDRKAEAEARRQRLIREASESPPPPASRARLGTIGAALLGIDAEQSRIVIDIKNFGQTPATDVRWEAVAGWFDYQPTEIVGSIRGTFGITEQGHAQNIMLILTRPVRSADIPGFVRGGGGIYALARIDYTDIHGDSHRRNIAYYVDPDGLREAGKQMLSICSTGNDEISEGKLDKARRQALIAKGRDLVHRFRTSGSEGFERFASHDRDYLDIQPHLGDKYQAERLRDAERVMYGSEHDDYRSAMFLKELARLEEEWKL